MNVGKWNLLKRVGESAEWREWPSTALLLILVAVMTLMCGVVFPVWVWIHVRPAQPAFAVQLLVLDGAAWVWAVALTWLGWET